MFCIECGQETSRPDHLCEPCYLSKTDFASIPDYLTIKECRHCGKYSLEGKASQFNGLEDALATEVHARTKYHHGAKLEGITIEILGSDPRQNPVGLEYRLNITGLEKTEAHGTILRIAGDSCKTCSKKMSGYFEAIIQLRADQRELLEEEISAASGHILKRVDSASRSGRNLFLTKQETVPGGIDYYLSEMGAAKSIASELAGILGGDITTTSSVYGQRDGRDLRRMTYSLRLSRFMAGDIFLVGESPYLFVKAHENGVEAIGLARHERAIIDHKTARLSSKLGGRELAETGIVVEEAPGELQVMDQSRYQTHTLLKPQGYSHDTNEVAIIRTPGGVYLLPK